ncbi:MAG: phage tail protein [Candidatus Devosia phytovorans]|uniref:Phage tail protein n=1 Tax=Candidatus Devosia phytovorans TaxID=3121372 RepID=A0AAJ5VVB7_9HYPH|nr:phage tail protein [Devosia sp.]WEK04575.1 MAG: phage tail protein [Devosia sp.]
MLYQVGPLPIDTTPFSATTFGRTVGVDLATKAIMGRRQPHEMMGEAEENISLTGQLLPTKLGGLTELALAESLATSGTIVPVMRGDGRMLGWYVIQKVSEQHVDLTRYGVGFVIRYTLDLVREDIDAAAGGAQFGGLVGMLVNLFEEL